MDNKKLALKKMERALADKIGVPVSNRPDFVMWYRKTLDYRLQAFIITLRLMFRLK